MPPVGVPNAPDGWRSLPRLADLDVENRRVLLLTDLAIPAPGDAVEPRRLAQALPTVRDLLSRGARLVVASRGPPVRPGEKSPSVLDVGEQLAAQLDLEIRVPDEVIGDAVTKLVLDVRAGELVLLENLDREPGEADGDPTFARALSELADAFVNDDFGSCHAHFASTVGVPGLLGERAIGLRLENQLRVLSHVLVEAAHPFVVLVGDSDVPLENFAPIFDQLDARDRVLIGGRLGAVLSAGDAGPKISPPLRRLLDRARARDVQIELPVDHRTSREAPTPASAGQDEARPPDASDIGPTTLDRFAHHIRGAGTVLWTGVMGDCKNPASQAGTLAIADAVAEAAGFSLAALDRDAIAFLTAHTPQTMDQIDHILLAGEAARRYLAGDPLAGLTALVSSDAG